MLNGKKSLEFVIMPIKDKLWHYITYTHIYKFILEHAVGILFVQMWIISNTV